MNLGGPELLIVVAIAVLLFGAGWLPKAARNLGKAKVELDEVQRQFNETKNSVVEATGVKELESTMRKANKVINTSPQKLMKDAAKTAVTGSGAAAAVQDDAESAADKSDAGETKPADATAADATDDDIEDAEIVDPAAPSKSGPDAAGAETGDDTNINIDFR